MENIEFFQDELSLAGEIAVSHKNNILTDRIFLQISGRKQISAQQVINGTTVQWNYLTPFIKSNFIRIIRFHEIISNLFFFIIQCSCWIKGGQIRLQKKFRPNLKGWILRQKVTLKLMVKIFRRKVLELLIGHKSKPDIAG